MSNKNNRNPNINKFFNKLFLSFPDVKSVRNNENFVKNNEIEDLKRIKYVYISKDETKWFIRHETQNQEIFLFGKIKKSIPQPTLLNLTFDKFKIYSDNCNAIINSNEVYIDAKYFKNNYPNFKTKLNESKINIIIHDHSTDISVIKLGKYDEDNKSLLNNLNVLLNELESYKLTNMKVISKNNDNNNVFCKICGKKLKRHEKQLCKKCSRKRHASNLLSNLLTHIEPQTPFIKKDLNNIFSSKNEINDCIWSLKDYNLIKEKNNEYYLVEKDILDKFLEKYYISTDNLKETPKKEETKKINKKCSICNKILPNSKFYKSKKTKDGLEDYCKNCKHYVNTANYLNELLDKISPGSEFKIDDLKNNFENPIEFNGKIWELQDFDLLTYDDEKDTYTLKDLETCQNYLNKYYISGSSNIKTKKVDETFTKQKQMDIVIDHILNGKTEKEAAELAGIKLYNITHWVNEGKNNSKKEYIEFYKRYMKAKKQAKINSVNHFYKLESFNTKTDLTIDDTLRKQQMENVLKEIGSGSSIETAASNSNITYETLEYWYKRGKQNVGDEYNEFYEKINILQSPIDVPAPDERPEEKIDEIQEKKQISEEKLPDIYKHILDPLPHRFKKIFKGVKDNESGFAWVRKDENRWRYERQLKDNYQTVSRQNIYELYSAVKENNYIWGVRNIEKAKETLKQSTIPIYIENDVHTENNELFKNILDPLEHKFTKRFKKPNSSGFAWITKINNSWIYNNPSEDIRIYDTNLYNLFLKVKKENLPWGVRDLEKAKKTLSQCKKPNVNKKNYDTNNKSYHNIKCEYFTNEQIIKAIINGTIKNAEIFNVINNFNEFNQNLIRIITTRNSSFTELFMEFNLKNSEVSDFKELIKQLNGNSIK